MFIIDKEKEIPLSDIILFLKKSEIIELKGYLEQLIISNPKSDHFHLSSDNYQKEITITLDTEENRKNYTKKVRDLLDE